MFFDGGCPLCRREVAHYRRLDRSGRIDWVDISREPDALAPLGVTLPEAMARLHVQDRHGALLTGVPAFAAVWAELPGYRHLARVVRSLGLVSLLDRAYTGFARRRYARRCAEGFCAARDPQPSADPQAHADHAARGSGARREPGDPAPSRQPQTAGEVPPAGT
jgi:predicted DCC family thiol-disulfide oxidoreductase YuxK